MFPHGLHLYEQLKYCCGDACEPLADALLLDHHQRILDEDFSLLNHQLIELQQDQIAARLGELVRDNRAAHDQERANRVKVKEADPQEMLGDVGLQKIIRWSHVETSAKL